MKIAIYIPREHLRSDARYRAMVDALKGCELYETASGDGLREGTDLILSIGGDGTYLSAAEIDSILTLQCDVSS